jgi:hypothetical protein
VIPSNGCFFVVGQACMNSEVSEGNIPGEKMAVACRARLLGVWLIVFNYNIVEK